MKFIKTSICIGSIAMYVLIGLLIIIVVFAYLSHDYNKKCDSHITIIVVRLRVWRHNIEHFFDKNGRYPDSLEELWEYAQKHTNSDGKIMMYVDLTSEMQSSIPEYRQLNDKGGYYYDPNTGDLRLNLTRPVKEYLPRYNGRFKDKIPSSL